MGLAILVDDIDLSECPLIFRQAMQRSIRFKVALITAVIMLLSMTAGIVICGYFFTNVYEQSLKSRSLAIAKGLQLKLDRVIQLGIPMAELAGFDRECAEVVESYEGISYAVVVGADGRALFHSDPGKKGTIIVGSSTGLSLAGSEEAVHLPTEGEPVFFQAHVPVLAADGEPAGAVVVGFPADLVTGKTKQLVGYATGVSLFFVSAAILSLLYFLTLVVTKPLARLISAMGEVGSGFNSHSDVEIETDDEIGQLARTFNLMSRRIRETTVSKEELEEHKAFLQTVIDGVADPIWVVGLDQQVLMNNRAAQGYLRAGSPDSASGQESPGNPAGSFGSENNLCPLAEIRRTGQPVTVIHRYQRVDGQWRIVELHASPFTSASGDLLGVIQVSRDITERTLAENQLRENESRLKHLAYHDALTGLPNRLLLHEHLLRAIAAARRSNDQVAILFCDLDRFKNINDSLGHAVGDQVLKEIASRIRQSLRECDVVSRLGGDEFAIILDQVKDVEHIATVARKLLAVLPQPVLVENQEVRVTVSIGASVYPVDSDNVESLMKFADIAMYQAKEGGRDNFRFYTPGMDSRSHELLLLEIDLRKALEENQFTVHYQPQIDLKTGFLLGLEAMVRWEHPERGMVWPGDFIPLAEESGLILPLGRWILHEVCRQARNWLDQGLPPVRVAVNISGRQFLEPDFVDQVERILAEADLRPESIELEITESVMMGNVDKAMSTLADLHRRGVSLVIDDFGTGYSSLAYLKQFPISSLKIDRTFFQNIIHDPRDAALASAVLALAHSLGLKVIAEGVETKEQLAFLNAQGFDAAQGYLFACPLPPDELAGYLKDSVAGKKILPAWSVDAC